MDQGREAEGAPIPRLRSRSGGACEILPSCRPAECGDRSRGMDNPRALRARKLGVFCDRASERFVEADWLDLEQRHSGVVGDDRWHGESFDQWHPR
jgi:hypothetical protein